MAVRGEIFSSQVITDKRTYFFNVKEDRTGCRFLNLVESKKLPNGEFDRHSIMVYEEDVDNFVAEFTKAARVIQKSERSDKSYDFDSRDDESKPQRREFGDRDRDFGDRAPRRRKFWEDAPRDRDFRERRPGGHSFRRRTPGERSFGDRGRDRERDRAPKRDFGERSDRRPRRLIPRVRKPREPREQEF